MSQILEDFDRMIRATEEVFSRVPDDASEWRPKEGMLTIGQQMLHMAGTFKAYSHALSTGEWQTRSIDEILKRNNDTSSVSSTVALRLLRRTASEFRQVIAGFDEDALGAPVYSPPFDAEIPRRRLILFCIEHHLSHKAELFVYLRLLGVPIGSKELYFGPQR